MRRNNILAVAVAAASLGIGTSAVSAATIADDTFTVSFSLFRSFGQWTGPGPDQTGGIIFNAGGEGVARPTSPGIGPDDTTALEIIENLRPFGGGATGDGVTELFIGSESPASVRTVTQFDATGFATITFDLAASFRSTRGDGTPLPDNILEAQQTTPLVIKSLGLRFFDQFGVGQGANRTIVGGLLSTPIVLQPDGVARSFSVTLPVLPPAERAALDQGPTANDFDVATVFLFVLDGPNGRQVTLDNIRLLQAGPNVPEYVLGDFNFDGGLDGSDVDPFVLALSDLDTYLADFADAFADAYPGVTLDASVVDIIGDFNGDGGFDGSDVDGFVEALSGGRPGTAAIPEPAALGLLAPAALLISRRRR